MSEQNYLDPGSRGIDNNLPFHQDEAARSNATDHIMKYVDGGFLNIKDIEDAIAKVEHRLKSNEGFTFYTMNLDHLSKLKRHSSFRTLYNRASFVSADGWPVALLAARRDGVSRTTGADLVGPLCDMAAREQYPIFLLGSTQKVLSKTANTLQSRYPALRIVGEIAPPFDFEPRSAFAVRYAEAIASSNARLCFVALGAPTQETFADFASEICPRTGFLCVGAALDFIAGAQSRAPRLFQRLGMEWTWRWALSPRRLGRRYLQSAGVFLRMLMIRLRHAAVDKVRKKTDL